MVLGTDMDHLKNALDRQGDGQSAGVPAAGELEGNAYDPLGSARGLKHWQASFIDRAGLDDRGNIFFAAFEMTRMPMVVTDPSQPDNPIVFTNRAFLDLTQYEEKDVIGRNCRFLQGPDTDRRTVDEVRTALAEQRAVAVDILNYKADGTPFWNALFIGPVFDRDGKLLLYFSSQMDITARRVSQESYLQAQKMEAIGQLTAGMAHDFNNLLQVINGNLELALLGLGPQHKGGEPIRRAQRAAMRAGKLTQQLLTFARKQRLEPRRVNLNALLVEFSDMLVRTLGDRIQLRLDLKPGLPPCMLDPTHLQMALLNVLVNARDAMPGGGEVTVATELVATAAVATGAVSTAAVSTAALTESERRATSELPTGDYVTICVIDHGEGMTREVARRAAEPFFTTKAPGTGLGLAMVHGFMQQSHGRLDIDSTPGQGTLVKMLFPAAGDPAAGEPAAGDPAAGEPAAGDPAAGEPAAGDPAAGDPAAGEPAAGDPATGTGAPGVPATGAPVDHSQAGATGRRRRHGAARGGERSRASILLVEDNDDVREVAENVLGAAGYEVLAAPGGEQALQLLENGAEIDLLFTDVVMPGGMNGLQLTERVRHARPGLPVLLTTGYMDQLPAKAACAEGLDVLAKPYHHADLLERVQVALRREA